MFGSASRLEVVGVVLLLLLLLCCPFPGAVVECCPFPGAVVVVGVASVSRLLVVVVQVGLGAFLVLSFLGQVVLVVLVVVVVLVEVGRLVVVGVVVF